MAFSCREYICPSGSPPYSSRHFRVLDGLSRALGPTIASMGETGLHTLGDFDCHVIWAHCGACKRAVQLETARLAAMYGAGLTIPELRARLTCARCGTRSSEIRIVFALPAR